MQTIQIGTGKPFKSARKTAVVSRVTIVTCPSAPQRNRVRIPVVRKAFEFSTEESGYFVQAQQCEKVS